MIETLKNENRLDIVSEESIKIIGRILLDLVGD